LISRGGTASTVVDIKLIIKSAINRLSASIILVHNHPSGTLHPSSQDDNITRRIKAAAEMMDIRLLDHVIISPTGFYSYSDNGRL
ncbi:MAG: JAB domain-containing protein, partial [Muribaculaceae bacterium]|nr:JAB domain-containing protein [Muribaculaceae bacterium]